MGFSQEERRTLLRANLPKSREVLSRLQDYLARTGLHYYDFARRINYSSVALYKFMAGTYERIASDDSKLCQAIIEFIEANPIGGDRIAETGKLYRTENVKLLNKYFHEALDKPLAYFIYGPPGTQKSYILKRLIEDLTVKEISKNGAGKRAFYVYCRSGIRTNDLMKRVAEAAGVPGVGTVDRILRNMRFELRGRRSLICLDEAQHLSIDCLEVVREMLDEPPHCSLLFAGSHNLKQIFEQMELEQWRSRLHEGKSLPGISDDEAREIVTGELGAGVPVKKMDALIEHARAKDFRQGKDFSYISARRLFWSVRDIKAAQAEKKASA